jgi:hypothetical protein
VVVGPGAQFCTLLEVWVLGVGILTLGAETALYAEYRGLQVPMALDHGPVTSSGKSASGPDPRIRHRIQIGMFRPIRVDHTNCLQVAIKTHSFNPLPSWKLHGHLFPTLSRFDRRFLTTQVKWTLPAGHPCRPTT